MITVRILSKDEIDSACALLYKTHIEQVQWNFSADNPSLIRVETINKRKILTDRFTLEAIWFGAFDGSTLVGCTRLCGVDENNKLEVEGYPISQVIAQFLPDDRSTCVESTRTAVAQKYTGQGVVKKLLLAAFKYCEENHCSIVGCVSNGYLKSLFKSIEYPLKMEQAFKYEVQDPTPVNFYFADYANSEIKHMINALCDDDIRLNNSVEIFKAFELVAPILPTPVYWHDVKGVVLGLNEHCLKGMGATRDVIGKVPYDFYPREIAEQILTHNDKVMRSGEIMSQDELIKDITTGEVKVFRNTKAPLYDGEGKVIGIIGSAIEVTAELKAAQLQIEINQAQQAKLKAQTGVNNCLNIISHAIDSYRRSAANEEDQGGYIDSQVEEASKKITLSKRERQVLHYLSLNKNPKEIAAILTRKEKKSIASKTIQAVIDSQLYTKFEVYSISQLVDKATVLNKIPFSPE